MTEIPLAVKPVCRLSLIRRYTSHAELGFFTGSQGRRKAGMKGAITSSADFPTWARTKLRRAPGFAALKGLPGDSPRDARGEELVFWF